MKNISPEDSAVALKLSEAARSRSFAETRRQELAIKFNLPKNATEGDIVAHIVRLTMKESAERLRLPEGATYSEIFAQTIERRRTCA